VRGVKACLGSLFSPQLWSERRLSWPQCENAAGWMFSGLLSPRSLEKRHCFSKISGHHSICLVYLWIKKYIVWMENADSKMDYAKEHDKSKKREFGYIIFSLIYYSFSVFSRSRPRLAEHYLIPFAGRNYYLGASGKRSGL